MKLSEDKCLIVKEVTLYMAINMHPSVAEVFTKATLVTRSLSGIKTGYRGYATLTG